MAQPRFKRSADSMVGKDYGYFIEKLGDMTIPAAEHRKYAAAYLLKAKSEQNWEEMMYAYKEVLHLSPKPQRTYYCDSMIAVAGYTKDKSLIASAYLTKGIVFYDEKNYEHALKNYLIANDILTPLKDNYLLYKVRFHMAQLKYFVGHYRDAAILYRECIRYYEEEDSEPYIKALHSLGMCYTRMGDYKLAMATNELGLKEAIKEGNSAMIPYFIHSDGINQYFLKNYKVAIKKLEQVMPVLAGNDLANATVANFYIGKSYMSLNQVPVAMPYFMKVDTAYRIHKFIRQDFRESYKILADFYSKQGDRELENMYQRRLIEADTLLDKNDKYVSEGIGKEYDTKGLKDDNRELRQSLFTKNIWISGFVIAFPIALVVMYLRIKKYRTQKLDAGNKNIENHIKSKKTSFSDTSDINQDVVTAITQKLKKFETEKKFLDTKIKLSVLASRFNTNTAYLSRIVMHHSGEKFTDYINNLRLDHIMSLLKIESKYRNYSYRALAEEGSFSSTPKFVTAFKKKFKITPEGFIAQWRKENEE